MSAPSSPPQIKAVGISPTTTQSSRKAITTAPLFLHVIIVGFHHLKGPIVEYCYPELPKLKRSDDLAEGQEATEEPSDKSEGVDEKPTTTSTAASPSIVLPEQWSFLPFAALPDGAHQKDTGSSFFTLPPLGESAPSAYHRTLFGLSKFRQIETERIMNKTAEMSRTHVQKAIVVVARMPAIGLINEKLSQVTEAYFDQLNFTDTSLLQEFHSSLMSLLSSDLPDDLLYSGLPLPRFVTLFQEKTLLLLKLVLLQRKILFYGSSMKEVGLYQICLLSLLGDTIRYLNHSGLASATNAELAVKNSQLATSKGIAEVAAGFTPPLFEEDCMFQPGMTLQQMDLLTTPTGEEVVRSFLIGTTNQLFEVKDDFYDVRVNVDTGDINVLDSQLESILRLSSADLKFITSICEAVQSNASMGVEEDSVFQGSGTHIRQMLHSYYQALAASALHSQSLRLQAQTNAELKEELQDQVTDILDEFHLDWVNAWARTPNFKALVRHVTADSSTNFDISSLGHPGHGATILDSIQIKLTSQLKNIRIEPNIAPVVDSIGKASGKLTRAFSGIYADIQRKAATDRSSPTSADIKEKSPTEETINFSTSKSSGNLPSEQAQKIVSGLSSWLQSARTRVSAHLEQWDDAIANHLADQPAKEPEFNPVNLDEKYKDKRKDTLITQSPPSSNNGNSLPGTANEQDVITTPPAPASLPNVNPTLNSTTKEVEKSNKGEEANSDTQEDSVEKNKVETKELDQKIKSTKEVEKSSKGEEAKSDTQEDSAEKNKVEAKELDQKIKSTKEVEKSSKGEEAKSDTQEDSAEKNKVETKELDQKIKSTKEVEKDDIGKEPKQEREINKEANQAKVNGKAKDVIPEEEAKKEDSKEEKGTSAKTGANEKKELSSEESEQIKSD